MRRDLLQPTGAEGSKKGSAIRHPAPVPPLIPPLLLLHHIPHRLLRPKEDIRWAISSSDEEKS